MYGEITVKSWLCRINFGLWPIFHYEVGHVYSDTLSHIKRVYANVRECTITYDNVQHITTRCSTMYNDVRQCTTMYKKMTSLRQYFCRTQMFYM